ncbi:hypothetical protein [Streptosporangium amethystogenes]|uniref:hypothetical protein n=1 Tax=Streptosporangium amethystogenes TaxID=2002 RepID=UPI0012FADC4E|nr:hypothetical protein [Streptosporangium amethystogenes]
MSTVIQVSMEIDLEDAGVVRKLKDTNVARGLVVSGCAGLLSAGHADLLSVTPVVIDGR